MKRYRFQEEEAVTEETTDTEETTEESTPDSHTQFVGLLTEMGLSAEQAEAIHQMAMDLIENTGEGNQEKVEASRMRRKRNYSRGGRRRGMMNSEREMRRGGRPGRRRMSADRRPSRRREMSAERMERQLRRQRREIQELRNQLQQFGAQPGDVRLSRGPVNHEPKQALNLPNINTVQGRVFDMLKDSF